MAISRLMSQAKRKDKRMPKQTLHEIAIEMGFNENALERENWVMLDERFAVIADDKGLHLTDALSCLSSKSHNSSNTSSKSGR